MIDDRRVQYLIDELLASTATPEEGRVARVFYEADRGGSHGGPRKDSTHPTHNRPEGGGRKAGRTGGAVRWVTAYKSRNGALYYTPRPRPPRKVGWVEFFTRPTEVAVTVGLVNARPNLTTHGR